MVGHLQFMVGQKHNLVGHLILPLVFPIGQNVRYVFRLAGQILILVGHCPMSDRNFKARDNCSSKAVTLMLLLLPFLLLSFARKRNSLLLLIYLKNKFMRHKIICINLQLTCRR